MWSALLALAIALTAAGGALAQQPEIPTPGQPPPGQPQQGLPQGVQAAPEEEPAQAIAPEPAPQALFGQAGYGIGGFAARPQYLDVDLGAAYTDNALLTPSDRLSTGIGTVGMDTDYSYIGSNLDILAQGNIAYLRYFDNAFPGTPYGIFNGTAMWDHPSDLLQWVVQETYMEGQVNPLAAATPFYLEDINYFTTGPYLNLNFTGSDRLSFYGLYSNTAFQSSPFNSQTFDGGATFTHGVSETSTVGLQLDSAYWSFDTSGVASDYNLRSARVVYYTVLARTRAAVGVGYGFEDFGGPYSGSPLATLDLSRQVSAFSSISVHAAYGYTTFANAMRANLSAPISAQWLTGAVPILATVAPYKDHLMNVGWNFARARTGFSVIGAYDKQNYAGFTPLPIIPTTESERTFSRELIGPSLYNNQSESVTAALTRTLRPTLFLRLQGSRSWSQYAGLDGAHLILTIVNLSLTKQFSKLGVALYVQRAQQDYEGTAAPFGFATGAYTEDRVGIQFTYDLLGRRRAGAAFPEIY